MKNKYGFLEILLNEPIYCIKKRNPLNEANLTDTLVVHGENKQQIVVIVNTATPDFLKSADYAFLNKVMEAVKLSKHEYALVNLSENKGVQWSAIQQELQPKKVLVFGDESFGFQAEKYRIASQKEFQFLLADTLDEIQQTTEKKKKLWESLQALFLNN